MAEVIVSIENEIELSRVTTLLDENLIPYRVSKMADSSFPSLSIIGRFEITISEKDYNDFLRLVEKVYPIRRVLEEPKKTKPNRFKVGLILYAFVMTVLFVKYYHIEERNNTQKNFEYQWNYDNTVLTVSHKKTGDISDVYYDMNYDFNYEKVISYKNGIKTVMFLDNDEDGQIEQQIFYDKTGEIIGKYNDDDRDGYFDNGLIILDNGDSLKFIDQNKNGVYEQKF